ncbi:MAG: protein of unknown function transrane [Proteobacteria bacterium]|nr:protein of unknown function transrane [Pseudomonadota bacterium]
MTKNSAPPRWLPFVVLGIGLAAISFGAVLARLAQGAGLPSLAIAALRLGLAALIISPLALWQSRRALLAMTRRQAALTLGAGFFLALHFASWISSLEYTSVASSTALVTTNLLWIAIASFLVFGEQPRRLMLVGMAVSIGGSLLIFWSDSSHSAPGSSPLLGNCLALFGSWCFSAYLLLGRRLRAELPLPAYVWLAYGAAALLLLLACGAWEIPLAGYGAPAYLFALGLALGPQLLGHTAYNWSLKHVSPTFVAVVTLGEPVGSALLAWIFFGESFVPLQGAGFALLLGGIYLAARGEGQ